MTSSVQLGKEAFQELQYCKLTTNCDNSALRPHQVLSKFKKKKCKKKKNTQGREEGREEEKKEGKKGRKEKFKLE